MTTEVSSALLALEQLSSSTSTSSSGPLNALLDEHFTNAKRRILEGDNPRAVITDLQKSVTRAKKDVEKGLKVWYGALGNLGKAVDRGFPANLAAISTAYNDPPLFTSDAASHALDRAVLESLGRRGFWEAVGALEEDTGMVYDPAKRASAEELDRIVTDIEAGDVTSALQWCQANSSFLSSPPHPSPLPYYLHRSVFLRLKSSPAEAINYAKNLKLYVPSQQVLQLLTSALYSNSTNYKSPYTELDAPQSLVAMFRQEFCRRHGWPKEEPLEVAVDLGSKGGGLNVIEKARRVMGEHLGNVRTWDELPMEVPLPNSRRYHSVFVCPVSKEQATESNPPKMLTCGHVIAEESFVRLLKGRRSVKCPYCPVETSHTATQRLYF